MTKAKQRRSLNESEMNSSNIYIYIYILTNMSQGNNNYDIIIGLTY